MAPTVDPKHVIPDLSEYVEMHDPAKEVEVEK